MKRPVKRTSPILQKVRSQRDSAAFQQLSSKMWVASKIAEIIRCKGWNKTQFAEIMQQTPSTITKWLSGEHNFTIDTLIAIEDVLGIDLLNRDRKKYEIGKMFKGTMSAMAVNIFLTSKDYSRTDSGVNFVIEGSKASSVQVVENCETGLN